MIEQYVLLSFSLLSFLKTIFVLMGTLLLLWPIFPATCTAQNSLHMKKPNTGLSSNSFSKIFIINHGPPLVFLSDSEMEEESKGEPSKVESANVELNQSPKKVFNQKLRFQRIMSSGCYIAIAGTNTINLNIQF